MDETLVWMWKCSVSPRRTEIFLMLHSEIVNTNICRSEFFVKSPQQSLLGRCLNQNKVTESKIVILRESSVMNSVVRDADVYANLTRLDIFVITINRTFYHK